MMLLLPPSYSSHSNNLASSQPHQPHPNPNPTPPQALILLFTEEDELLILAAWTALDAVASTIPKEEAPGHVIAAKDAVQHAKEKVGWGSWF